MGSIILNITARYLGPVLVVLSLIALYRGHNLPGGGFIGGLVAASGILLVVLASGWKVVDSAWWPDPVMTMVAGLAIAVCSGGLALASGDGFMTGLWLPAWQLPVIGKVKLGTPLLFDLGVYLTVLGFTLKCAYSLGREVWK